MSSASQNQAAWLTAVKAYPLEVGPAPMPTPEGTDVVILVHSAAINPADPAVQRLGIVVEADKYPYVLGTDVAGIVHSVGPDQTRFKTGERVVALGLASLHKDSKYGGFQLYSVADAKALVKIPDHVSFNEGCVLPLGLCTAAYSLFEKRSTYPSRVETSPTGKVLLVWGGASSLRGYTVAATSSTKNFGLLREIGAEYVFDYNKDGVVDDIGAPLQCAVIAGQLEGRKHVGTVRPPGFPPLKDWPEGIEVSHCASTHILHSEVGPAIWGAWLEGALEDGTMLCRPPYEVVGQGLEEVQKAMDIMGKGVSGKKLVVEIVH
ncbi:zinc-binding alcohol dehydrogenase domain-containing protein cipB [Roridomyces roridus]|uniref:Zinc-binding alcohol dehydrogenase domain-containing protein cipB n=1 Tax=Roridomyces roridus TaxID=1738132 RepID=A0AAD7BXA5_9AGAR|nr:zinc-binding alcohol dehydrogenase domain-containing protein cipB [Roridomyces roridus]